MARTGKEQRTLILEEEEVYEEMKLEELIQAGILEGRGCRTEKC